MPGTSSGNMFIVALVFLPILPAKRRTCSATCRAKQHTWWKKKNKNHQNTFKNRPTARKKQCTYDKKNRNDLAEPQEANCQRNFPIFPLPAPQKSPSSRPHLSLSTCKPDFAVFGKVPQQSCSSIGASLFFIGFEGWGCLEF